MKRTNVIRASLLPLFCCLLLIAADNALVVKKTNLRRDPSAQQEPIRVLLPEEELRILDNSSSQNYFKVRAEDNKTGWVWRRAVEVLPDPNKLAGSAPVVPPPPAAGAISPDWPKPDPVDEVLEGSEGSCPAAGGTGGDTATNVRKNRTDALPEVHDVPWAAIASLPFPAAPPSRATWTKAQLAQIQPFEGVALRTTGFLSHPTNVESSGKGESTNCHFHQPEDVDWHIYLVEHDGDGIDKSVIVETTPRVRRRFHPKWDAAVLDRWVGSGKPIRVSGFLMLDPEHRNQVGKFRVTVWELHPIMNIEVCDASSCGESDWKPLDQVQ